ncbi:MAG: VWA domain-containing protein [Deltaproteobacteria bacterium]|nr:VWA domain-containing protein [Deltaproteobacteria bacterium]
MYRHHIEHTFTTKNVLHQLHLRRPSVQLICAAIVTAIVCVAPDTRASEDHSADIIVVLDLSGSMKSDDTADRFNAFFSWASTFKVKGDRIGIVAMGNGARLIAPLTEAAEIDFAKLSNRLKRRAKYTDVAAGLENAYYELKNNSRPKVAKLILLYSDAQIDMPKGTWDMENSLRYLRGSLIPSLSQEQIGLLAIVPDGLKANFPLLQEMAVGTNGVYYRGLPPDAVATRHKILQKQYYQTETPAAIAAGAPKATPHPQLPLPSESQSESAPPVLKTKAEPSESPTAAGSGVPKEVGGIGIGFLVLAGVLLMGFTIMLVALAVLFRRTRQPAPTRKEELVDVLQELQSLKSETEKSGMYVRQIAHDMDADGEPNFGEPQDELSLSMVTPFLDYEEAKAVIHRQHPVVDEIAASPAFEHKDAENGNLSVSTMETLIGTAAATTDDKERGQA